MYCTPISPDSKARVQRLIEFSLNLVQELHGVRHTVKCHCPSLVIYIHPYPGGIGDSYSCAFAVMYKRVLGFRAVQTPRLLIPPKAASIIISFPLNPPVSHSDVYFGATPVHFPVVATAGQTLLTEHLLPVFEAIGMLRVWLWLIAHPHHRVSIWQVQVCMGCWRIYWELTGI